MRVRCVKGYPCYLTEGFIYETVSNEQRRNYYVVIDDTGRDHAWPKNMFIVAENNLPIGWKYCKCGSSTKNEMCCDCKK